MQEYKSKVDIVYDYILDNIVNQNIKNGDRIIIRNVAQSCGVSEIPVREALRRLESEGYLAINANHGATVVGISAQSIINYFQIKAVLEGYATRLSIDYITPANIKQLRNIIEMQEKAFQNKDAELYSELNQRFHQKIYEPLPQRELVDLIDSLWKKWRVTRSVFSLVPLRMFESHKEHGEILQLIEEKKYDEVETYVREHKLHSASEMANELNQGGKYY